MHESMRNACGAVSFALLGAAGLGGVLPVPAAKAAIRCNGPYQIVKGHGEISTPYCGDGYLAKVAREYGSRVSAKVIRQNPSKKQEVCRLVGFDPRVSTICAPFNDHDSGHRR